MTKSTTTIFLNDDTLWAIIEAAEGMQKRFTMGAPDPETLSLVPLYYNISAAARAIIIDGQQHELDKQKKLFQEESDCAQAKPAPVHPLGIFKEV